MPPALHRRQFMQHSASTLGVSIATPYLMTSARAAESKPASANDRLRMGAIGTGDRWSSMGRNSLGGVGGAAAGFGDYVAFCDVDAYRKERARHICGSKGDVYEDYRELLDRQDIDMVTIVSPDHWHTKMSIDAMRAGKDVYCEKPLTLTIEEGRQICKVAKETGAIFQVGTQQRSEMGLKFLKAVAIAQSGRLGDITRVTCAIGGAPASGEIPVAPAPANVNWDMWLGQAPMVQYRQKSQGKNHHGKSRMHYEFRWWYEYSGGKLTDWGAHHIDIAQWAIGMDESGPTLVEPLEVKFPVLFKDGHPTRDDQYNTPTHFKVRCKFPNGVEMFVRNDANDLGFGNGILIEGSKGKILVNRGKLVGKPVDELKDNPLPDDALTKLCKGKQPGHHMRNLVDCIRSRDTPISDVFTHHRAMTTCHLANIALRLGRSLTWDPKTEKIVGDDEAASFASREQRKGYEIEV